MRTPGSSRLAVALTVALTTGTAADSTAHELGEHRHVLVAIGADAVDLLVVYELGDSTESRRLDAVIDADRDGRVDTPLERFVAHQLFAPRLSAGLSLHIDGAEVALEVGRIDTAPESRLSGTGGWNAAAHFVARRPVAHETPNLCTWIEVRIARTSVDTVVAAEVDTPLTVEATRDGVYVDSFQVWAWCVGRG